MFKYLTISKQTYKNLYLLFLKSLYVFSKVLTQLFVNNINKIYIST